MVVGVAGCDQCLFYGPHMLQVFYELCATRAFSVWLAGWLVDEMH